MPYLPSGSRMGGGCPRRSHRSRASHRGIARKYASDLEKLAKWCESNGLNDEARKTRRVLSPTDPYKLYVPALPDEVGPPKLPDDAAAKVVDWNAKLWKLRQRVCRDVLRDSAAGNPLRAGGPGVRAGARRHPGEPRLRARTASAGLPEVPRPMAHALRGAKAPQRLCLERQIRLAARRPIERRYEAGERNCDGRWISAEEDAETPHRHA